MRTSAAIAALAVGALAVGAARPALAQTTFRAPGSLQNFQPSPAGDAFYSVPSPWASGHLVFRAAALFDYAINPLAIESGTSALPIVSAQAFAHVNVSFALWDRLLISANMPFAAYQAGDQPVVNGVTFLAPPSAAIGDLRLGARVRLYGDYWGPFQLGIGGNVYVPTGPGESYAGEGAVRGEPQLLFGGHASHFVWSASAGAILRASARPHTFNAGVGAAAVLGDGLVQIGPEATMAVPLSEDKTLTFPDFRIEPDSTVSAEILMGVKVRPISGLVLGGGAGPGLTHAWGTPVFRAVGMIGWSPEPENPARRAPSSYTPTDRDGDGIFDPDDACSFDAGVASDDPKKNGCPPDADGDGVADAKDACPNVKGVPSDDPEKSGCPSDLDGDGIPDAEDACPRDGGQKNADLGINGCPPDKDEDGIADAKDACPDEPGSPNKDAKQNGCPRQVRVANGEIFVTHQVKFKHAGGTLEDVSEPVPEELFFEVRDALRQHPEIRLIEIQGHADSTGDEGFNRRLSEQRAISVRRWLIQKGIPGDKLVVRGYGTERPQATNKTEEGRQENRRVQFFTVIDPDKAKK